MVRMKQPNRTTGHRIERQDESTWTTVVLAAACPEIEHARAVRRRLAGENPEERYRILEVKTTERMVS